MARQFNEGQLMNWYNHSLLLPERVIVLDNDYRDIEEEDNGYITSAMASRFIKNISVLEATDDSQPILIILNDCSGGSYNAGSTIYDRIQESPCHVTMRCYGQCMSMGTIILQAADMRELTPHSQFMIHDGEEGITGVSPQSFKNWADFAQIQLKEVHEIYHEVMKEKNPKMSMAKVRELCRHDRLFTAQQAVELGLADRVYTGIGDQ